MYLSESTCLSITIKINPNEEKNIRTSSNKVVSQVYCASINRFAIHLRWLCCCWLWWHVLVILPQHLLFALTFLIIVPILLSTNRLYTIRVPMQEDYAHRILMSWLGRRPSRLSRPRKGGLFRPQEVIPSHALVATKGLLLRGRSASSLPYWNHCQLMGPKLT